MVENPAHALIFQRSVVFAGAGTSSTNAKKKHCIHFVEVVANIFRSSGGGDVQKLAPELHSERSQGFHEVQGKMKFILDTCQSTGWRAVMPSSPV